MRMKNNVIPFLLLMTFSSAFAQKKFKIPPYLKVGDTLAIIAPAGILKNKQEAF
jgi:muramoyltetrapeptide carboxypeptidase